MNFNDIYQGLIAGRDKLALVGLGYAGPRSADFVWIVTHLKEKDLQEAGLTEFMAFWQDILEGISK